MSLEVIHMDWMLRTRAAEHNAIRSTMLKFLASREWEVSKDKSAQALVEATISKLEELELISVQETARYSDSQELQKARVREDREFHRKILDVVWELVVEGVITLGDFVVAPLPNSPWVDKLGYEPSSIGITAYGKRCLQEDRILPHDLDGYLADLQRRCGALDPEVEVLVRESLLTFQANCLVASVILIGAASERLIRVLFESYRDAHQNQSDLDRLDRGWENRRRRFIAQKFTWLWQQLATGRTELNNAGRLWDGAEGLVRATFDMLRTARNEAVHQNRHFERIQTNELLFLFVPYAERICALINYFQGVTY